MQAKNIANTIINPDDQFNICSYEISVTAEPGSVPIAEKAEKGNDKKTNPL